MKKNHEYIKCMIALAITYPLIFVALIIATYSAMYNMAGIKAVIVEPGQVFSFFMVVLFLIISIPIIIGIKSAEIITEKMGWDK